MKKDPQKQNELLTEKEVQKEYKINARTLQRERNLGMGMPYIKLNRRVRYQREIIERYLAKNTKGDFTYK